MQTPPSTWLLAYDIACDKHRRRCLRSLRQMAEGYQKSVFEVVSDTHGIDAVMEGLASVLDDKDSLLAVRTLPFSHAWHLGKGPTAPVGGLIIID